LAQIAPDHVVLRQGAQEASISLPAFAGAARAPVQK
jgi:3,4-dihydroxy-2-butanone 4-phosphate synthase